MKALILAGGLGTRLRPLTHTRPKHLLPIANRPHVDHVLELLRAHDVAEVVLLTSYLGNAFEETVEGARANGMTVEVTHEAEPLGTAGALKNAQDLVGDETFLAINGDILTDVDLVELVAWHRAKEAIATILLTAVDDPSAFGVVPTEDDGRVLGFIEKPPPGEAPTNLINAGVYVFEPEVLRRIPAGEMWSAERALFPDLVASGAALFARGTDAYWMDIGTPQKYLQANLDALGGAYRTSAVETPGPRATAIDAAALVDDGAQVSSACVGAGARIEDGAVVEESVLLPATVVEAGATVTRSILGVGARVEAGARVSGATAGDGELLSA